MASSTVNKLDKLGEKNENKKRQKEINTSNDTVQSKNTFNRTGSQNINFKKVRGRLWIFHQLLENWKKNILNCTTRRLHHHFLFSVMTTILSGTDSIPPTRQHLNEHFFSFVFFHPPIFPFRGEIVKTLLKCNQEKTERHERFVCPTAPMTEGGRGFHYSE